jgi:hypothetical protein
MASAFLPQSRGDKLGENYTHADGVIGHFSIGDSGIDHYKRRIIKEAVLRGGFSFYGFL